MIALLVVVGIATLLGWGGLYWALARSLRAPLPAPAAPEPAPVQAPDKPRKGVTRAEFDKYALAVEALQLRVAQLPTIWQEEADRANRAAERAEKAGRRARAKRSDEDSAPDQFELSGADGSGGAQGELPAVREAVAGPAGSEAYLNEVRRSLALAAAAGTRAH